jgi:hypothetical protein
MKTRLSAVSCSLLLAGTALASDHEDGFLAASDPGADILDFYAFMNPPCTVVAGSGCEAPPEELILALTVHRHATEETRFSDGIVYRFNFENDVGEAAQIECSVNEDQFITCAGLEGLSVTAPVGEVGVNGDIRVFAGLRDDPMFADTDALRRMSLIGTQAFNAPGVDTLAGENVLAIVIGIKNASFPAGSGAVDSNGHPINVQKVWVASERIKAAVNAGISGSWYNPEQDGQGWVIEMIGTPSGSDQFLFYFYGYEDSGEQLWLLGITPDIASNRLTMDVLRFEGMGFGGGFDPGSTSSEVVGSMTFEFHDCDRSTVSFTPATSELTAFENEAQRLTSIGSTDCQFSDLGQVDRVGRPLVSLLIPEGQRDLYGMAADPASWDSMFRSAFRDSLSAVDLADGIQGNAFLDPAELAPLLADDRLKVDLEWSACQGVWGIELSALVPQPNTNDCGGRGLDDDVLEEFFSMVISGFDPLVDDFVRSNDKPFLSQFPFLATPH